MMMEISEEKLDFTTSVVHKNVTQIGNNKLLTIISDCLCAPTEYSI